MGTNNWPETLGLLFPPHDAASQYSLESATSALSASDSTGIPSLAPSPEIGAPASTFTPPGRKLAYALAATIASAFSPTMSLGRPGR